MPSELPLRPKFYFWLRERGMNYTAIGRELNCSRETVRRYCLPFDDPGRRFPTRAIQRRIVELTKAQVTGHDFIEPASQVAAA